MNREPLSNTFKGIVILAATVALALALSDLPKASFSWGFFVILASAVIVTPRMSLTLPRSRFAISFSDAAVFLTFLMYGGPAAIVVAALESASNCYHLRSKGFYFGKWMIPTNVSINTVATSLTFVAWTAAEPLFKFAPNTTQYIVSTVGILALSQFLFSSWLVAIFTWTRKGTSPWQTWKNDCFTSSMTQIVGAGLAGLIFKLISYRDVLTGSIAMFALAVLYLSYRQSITEVTVAMQQTEEAEREKADIERERRQEAEKYAGELAATLDKEERANEALRKSEKDLQHAALHDSLTNLPNRKHFGDKLRLRIEQFKDDPSRTFYVLFLDIRKFKNINDSLGHTLGDKVLIIAAKRFVRMLNSTDMVARIGGDEFAVILTDISSIGKAQKVARRIFDSIAQPFSLSGNNVTVSVNIGIAPCDAEYNTPEEVLRDADIAMHYAKEWNSGVAVFTKELREKFLERIRYENDLRHALDRNELAMSYQPLIDIQDGSLMGFEALLRWNHSEIGNIPPNKFIPIAEESGLIIPITVWILKETTRQIAAWQQIGPEYKDLVVSVNISGKHLSNDDLITDVREALDLSNIDPYCLKLEITESAAMENAEHTIDMLNRLKLLGVQLSIDDFGTGYSSLSYLHRLPFDTLKIDRSFVYSVGEKGENSEILQTIISLAKNLKKKVIAEGIETESQLHLLQNLGCDYGQGYLLARPQTRENAEQALYERKSWMPARISDRIENAPQHIDVEENMPVF